MAVNLQEGLFAFCEPANNNDGSERYTIDISKFRFVDTELEPGPSSSIEFDSSKFGNKDTPELSPREELIALISKEKALATMLGIPYKMK